MQRTSDSIIHQGTIQADYKRALLGENRGRHGGTDIFWGFQRTPEQKRKTRNERDRRHGNCILPSAQHPFILNLFFCPPVFHPRPKITMEMMDVLPGPQRPH